MNPDVEDRSDRCSLQNSKWNEASDVDDELCKFGVYVKNEWRRKEKKSRRYGDLQKNI